MVTQKEINSVLAQDKKVQFEYLIKRVADFEEIWLINDSNGLVLLEAETNQFVLPVWPFKEYAELFCVEDYKECIPEAVSLYDFLEEDLISLKENKCQIGIMPVYQKPSVVVTTEIFVSAIIAELEKYE